MAGGPPSPVPTREFDGRLFVVKMMGRLSLTEEKCRKKIATNTSFTKLLLSVFKYQSNKSIMTVKYCERRKRREVCNLIHFT